MILTYDGTFSGLLSVVFEVYRLKITVSKIVPEDEWQSNFFDQATYVETNSSWANRVQKGIEKKASKKMANTLYQCFLSEQADISMLLFNFIQKLFDSPTDISDNYGDDTVLRIHQIKKKIGREVHRMHAFVRFQQTKDDIYYAVIEPDFNVMPLLPKHFLDRYPAQKWLLYDSKRRYGVYYDMHKTEFITFEDDERLQYRQLNESVLDQSEPEYQILWKSYFDSVNIPERRNMKLHLQHVPKRYWKYLSEKRQQF
ncbi:MAG: TIGR03915 family putative DNA repair protein [Saprospiraceae bacterium]